MLRGTTSISHSVRVSHKLHHVSSHTHNGSGIELRGCATQRNGRGIVLPTTRQGRHFKTLLRRLELREHRRMGRVCRKERGSRKRNDRRAAFQISGYQGQDRDESGDTWHSRAYLTNVRMSSFFLPGSLDKIYCGEQEAFRDEEARWQFRHTQQSRPRACRRKMCQ